MDTTETKLDLETLNATSEKIKYYSCIPRHIKGRVSTLDNTTLKESVNDCLPAHVVNGFITAIRGRINIPDINKITRLYTIDEPPLLLLTNP